MNTLGLHGMGYSTHGRVLGQMPYLSGISRPGMPTEGFNGHIFCCSYGIYFA